MVDQEITTSPLLPLLESLQHFHSLAALDTRIRDIYAFLDCDGSGALSKVLPAPCVLLHACIPACMLTNSRAHACPHRHMDRWSSTTGCGG